MPSHAITPASTSSAAPLIWAETISARPKPNVKRPPGGRAASRAAASASAIAPASVSMCAASESSASESASSPATISTTKKPRIRASATAEPAVVGVGRRGVAVGVARVTVVVRRHGSR